VNGTYTAPSSINSAQTITITATSQADPTKSASATVNLVPVVVSMTPPLVILAANRSQILTVAVAGTYNTNVTWTVSPANVGTLLNGVYTAPAAVSTIQLITITATSQADPTKSAVSLITLMPRRAPGE
jgi:hypothetical protein